MNKNKLLGKIKEHGTTLEQFALELGISLSAIRRKINGNTVSFLEE